MSNYSAPGTFKSARRKNGSNKVWIAGCSIALLVLAVAAMVVTSPAKPASHTSIAAAQPAQSASSALTPAARARVHASYAALPLAFEANQGQTDPQVKYVARGSGYTLFLTKSQAVMRLPARKRFSEVRDMMLNKRRGAAAVRALRHKGTTNAAHSAPVATLRMNLLGANPRTQLTADDVQPGTVNYFLGKDPSKWHSNVPLYGRVSYRNIYPGVDLAFHGASQHLEFDYLVSPGADAAPIALSFQGADSIRTDDSGNLLLTTSSGPVQLNKPVAYQSENGVRKVVPARFVLKAQNEVAFELGSYDHNRQLVIDPTVSYSTYFGGDFADYGISIAVDASGNSYIVGATDSDTLPGFVTPTNNESFDTFVTKLSPSGALQFTTEFGGSGDEFPGGIAIDSQGIYISGTTDSDDFPTTAGVVQPDALGGPSGDANDAFAVKLTTGGSLSLPGAWGTYIAGTDSDSGLAVAVDSGHNVYVVGETFSSDLGGSGAVNPLQNGNAINLGTESGADDGYIAKLNSTGTAYSLISYIGGSNGDLATGVALDGSGNIYVSGETISSDLPVTSGVVQTQCGTDGNCNSNSSGSFDDAFVVSIKANLSGYNYVTYYGGSDVDDAFAITADAAGNAFITGTTASSDFPTSDSPAQGSLGGSQNAFVVELNSTGTTATYGTYFGGNGSDFGLGVAVDGSDNVYFTGQTSSSNFPTVNPTQSGLSGSSDAFVSVLGLSQGQVLFSTYLGGGGDEDQLSGSVALDSAQNIYVTGDTDSGSGSAFPTTTGALDTTYGGGSCQDSIGDTVPCTDAFVTSYGPATAPDFTVTATTPSAVSAGGMGSSTVTLTALNAYVQSVTLTCSVSGSGSPLPTCASGAFSTNPVTPTGSGATSTLTITTTGAQAALARPSKIFYAMWLPIVGLSLVGMRFSTKDSRRKKLLGFLLLGLVMSMLFFLPACGGSNNNGGGGGGCSGCTPAGSYTITITGTDVNNLAHSTNVSLSVN